MQFLDATKLGVGLRALRCLPTLGPRGELLVDAGPIERIDAWLATALRTLIEYRARHHQVRVILDPPRQRGARLLLARLLGEPPAKFFWKGYEEGGIDVDRRSWLWKPATKRALERRVVLPAQRFNSHGVQDAASWQLLSLMKPTGHRREMGHLVRAFCEFVENGMIHGSRSAVGTIGTIACDLRRGHAEAVVIDLGEGVSEEAFPGFVEAVSASSAPNRAGLATIMEGANRRGLRASLTFATGPNVLIGRDAGWRRVRLSRSLPGFTAAAKVRW